MKEIEQQYGVITISTTISRPLWDKARKYNIGWSEALRVGLTFLLSKREDGDYQNPMQMERKIEALATRLNEMAQENYKLQEQVNSGRWQK